MEMALTCEDNHKVVAETIIYTEPKMRLIHTS